MIDNNMNLQKLLEDESFRLRTPMYIGEWCFSAFRGFILGWMSRSTDKENQILHGFHDFVADYYNWKESTAGWKNIIFAENSNDDRKSINKFFYLYDMFKTTHINME